MRLRYNKCLEPKEFWHEDLPEVRIPDRCDSGHAVVARHGRDQRNEDALQDDRRIDQLDDSGKDQRLRVGGDVGNSIHREGHEVRFTLTREKLVLPMDSSGIESLPDTLKPDAQALPDGKVGVEGVFHATKIRAKCASKYEAEPIQEPAAGPRVSL